MRRNGLRLIVVRLRSPVPEAAQDAELLTAAAVALNRHADVLRELGALFAAAGHELYLVGGSVRDAVLQRLSHRSGLRHRRAPRAAAEIAAAVGRRAVGHRHRVRHRRRREGRPAPGDHHVPRRPLRPGVPQPAGAVRRLARRRSGAPRFHGERDGGAHHGGRGRRIRRSPRRFGRAARRRAGYAGGAVGVFRRRPAADAARRAVRLATRLHGRPAGARGDRGDGAASWAGSPPSGWPPSWTSCCWATTRSPVST